jgi:hypothetical protein
MVLSLALLLSGCALRTPIVKAPTPSPIRLAAVHDQYGEAEVAPLPAELVERLEAMLQVRDLRPRRLDGDALSSFSSQRSTANRLALLSGDDLVFLAEAEAEYVSQINGRMRWAVDVTLSLDPPDADPITSTFSVTVFLLFMHQDAEDAILDAAPVIERHVGYMFDEYFTSLQ